MNQHPEIMFAHIVEMQCELNEKTVPNWLEKNLDWETAILVEVAEAIDSTDWKWWKHTETDLVNLKIEAIDLLHFLVAKRVDNESIKYELHTAQELVVVDLSSHFNECRPKSDCTIVEMLKGIASGILRGSTLNALAWLACLFDALEMDAQAIYKAYVTKNLLNHYRQERGYKDPNGDYLKIINGQEDNIVFAAVIENVLAIETKIPLSLEQIKKYAFESMDWAIKDAREIQGAGLKELPL